jgi:hypothetical protein
LNNINIKIRVITRKEYNKLKQKFRHVLVNWEK